MILNIIGGAIIFLIGMLIGYKIGLKLMVKRTEAIIDAITQEYQELTGLMEENK